MSNLSESNMYDWRVAALMNWIEKNKDENGKLSMEKLSAAGHLDQYHYLGLKANDEVIEILGLKAGIEVLDVGSGIGGPARYLAWKSGCRVTGVDIQPGLVQAGNEVTRMVNLSDRVSFVCGNVVEKTLFKSESFHAFISLLVILHIEDRDGLFESLYSSLKTGGVFLIDDMVKLSPFDEEEDRIAKEVIGSPFLPTVDEYEGHLEAAGFVDVEFETLTPEWVQWCVSRSEQYDAGKDKQIQMHGEKVYMQRSSFYADVKRLFLSGKLGGVRITGRKPGLLETSLRQYRERLGTNLSNVEQVVSIIERE